MERMNPNRAAFAPARIVVATMLFLGAGVSPAQTVRTVADRLPLSFEANAGQFDKRVKFLARAPGQRLFLTADGVVLVLERNTRVGEPPAVLGLEFDGMQPEAGFEGVDRLTAVANYFYGRDATKHVTDVPSFARVRHRNVYPGVDVVYYGNRGSLEYDFVVAPGADAKRIKLRLNGHESAIVADSGDLVLSTPAGDVTLKRPAAYQEREGQRAYVPVRYVLAGREVALEVSPYDTSRTLLIDPLLGYSTFLSGSGDDKAHAITVDASGNVYVVGQTTSSNFPVANAFQGKFVGTSDAFVTKLNPSGGGLVYSTYLGGSRGDTSANGVAIDAAGNAYITGTTTSSTFPVTTGAYQTAIGANSGFVTKLNPQGNALVYSTFVGGGQGNAIALDASGNAFVVGRGWSNFLSTPGAFEPAYPGGSSSGFVLKLNATGSAASYATFLGGFGFDIANGVAVDSAGDAYVTGTASSDNFPVVNAFQPIRNASQNAFVSKLNPSGNALVYSTYLGGSGAGLGTLGNAVAVDSLGQAHVVGTTYSAVFPTVRAFQPNKPYTGSGQQQINLGFITKFDPTGTTLVYSSYWGGSSCLAPGVTSCLPNGDEDSALAVTLDAAGNAYIAGHVRSIQYPAMEPIQPSNTPYGNSIPFVAKVQDRGTSVLVYSLALGTKDTTSGNGGAAGVAVDSAGNAYVAGYVIDAFPTTPGAFQVVTSFPCCVAKTVVFKISPGRFTTGLIPSNFSPTSADTVTLTANVTSAVPGGTVAFSDNGNLLGTAPVSSGTATLAVTFPAGVHQLTATYSGDNKVSPPVFLPVRQATN